MFLSGGGVKGGTSFRRTDDFGCATAEDLFHVHDCHATMLHMLGINHLKLTCKYQGRVFRLIDVHGHVIKKILG